MAPKAKPVGKKRKVPDEAAVAAAAAPGSRRHDGEAARPAAKARSGVALKLHKKWLRRFFNAGSGQTRRQGKAATMAGKHTPGKKGVRKLAKKARNAGPKPPALAARTAAAAVAEGPPRKRRRSSRVPGKDGPPDAEPPALVAADAVGGAAAAADERREPPALMAADAAAGGAAAAGEALEVASPAAEAQDAGRRAQQAVGEVARMAADVPELPAVARTQAEASTYQFLRGMNISGEGPSTSLSMSGAWG